MARDIIKDFFRGDMIKVFPTKKEVPTFSMPRGVLKQAFPFLIASTMVLTACHKKENTVVSGDNIPQPSVTEIPAVANETTNEKDTATINWDEIYKEVINKYSFGLKQDKEPLSQAQIQQIMSTDEIPVLTDENFNHLPENEKNFWEIVYNGVAVTQDLQNSSSLTPEEKKTYQIMAYKMLSQVTKIKGTDREIDVNDYNNLKTFLYFEKVINYKDDINQVMNASRQIVNEQSEFFGRYYKDYLKFQEKAEKVPQIEKFAEALYYSNSARFMLSYSDSIEANKISKKMLSQWLEENHITDKNLWYYTQIEDNMLANNTNFYYARGKNLRASIGIDSRGKALGGYYTPVGLIPIHELQHLGDRKAASNEKAQDNRLDEVKPEPLYNFYLSELGPTLYTLAKSDAIYKEIHHIDPKEILHYGTIDMGAHKAEAGEIAVWFNQVADKYPGLSLGEILSKNEVFEKLKNFAQGGRQTPVKVQQSER